MRLYLPATVAELGDADRHGFPARRAHAVTEALRAASPGESEEDLEVPAFYAAADASLALLTTADVPLRVVVSADVSAAEAVADGGVTEVEAPAVPWSAVVSIHVDDPDDGATVELVRRAVAAALAGDDDAAAEAAEQAAARVDELDLLWFDASELATLLAATERLRGAPAG